MGVEGAPYRYSRLDLLCHRTAAQRPTIGHLCGEADNEVKTKFSPFDFIAIILRRQMMMRWRQIREMKSREEEDEEKAEEEEMGSY